MKTISAINRVLLLLTVLLAAYQVAVGIDGLDTFAIILQEKRDPRNHDDQAQRNQNANDIEGNMTLGRKQEFEARRGIFGAHLPFGNDCIIVGDVPFLFPERVADLSEGI